MNENAGADQIAPHERPAADVAADLGTDTEPASARRRREARLERAGPNELETEAAAPAWRRLLAQFKDALVLLLVAAAVISCAVWAVERDTSLPYEGLVIITIVLLNAILGFVQEGRAEEALAALRAMAAPEASVVRDGEQRRVATRELVPGDLLIINEGDTVSADARLIDVVELQTLEASLTGESVPVLKSPEPVDRAAGIGDRLNMVFAGTTASYGHARAVVTATGMRTELGKIAGMLRTTKSPTTPLQRELDRTGKQLGIAVIVIAAVVVATLFAPLRRARCENGCPGVDVRRRPRCRGRTRGVGRRRHRGAGDGRSADGPARRDRAQASGGGNPRLGHGDRFGQDRNADSQ